MGYLWFDTISTPSTPLTYSSNPWDRVVPKSLSLTMRAIFLAFRSSTATWAAPLPSTVPRKPLRKV